MYACVSVIESCVKTVQRPGILYVNFYSKGSLKAKNHCLLAENHSLIQLYSLFIVYSKPLTF